MSKKTKPHDPHADRLEFFRAKFNSYSDHDPAGDLPSLADPNEWPHQCALVFRGIPGAVATIDASWAHARNTFFDRMYADQLLQYKTRDDLIAAIKNIPPDMVQSVIFPPMEAAIYLAIHFPEKMQSAFMDLVEEAYYFAIIRQSQRLKNEPPSASEKKKLIASLTAREKRAMARRLTETLPNKPKSNRGRRPQWTSDSLGDAIETAARNLTERETQKPKNERAKSLEYRMIAKELRKSHPKTAHLSRNGNKSTLSDALSKQSDALRKLIERHDLEPLWLRLRREWRAAVSNPSPNRT